MVYGQRLPEVGSRGSGLRSLAGRPTANQYQERGFKWTRLPFRKPQIL